MITEGTILLERYEVISKIGTGGMANVYKARDQKLNRLVAVKVLKQEFKDDKTFIAKFQKEAQAAAGLAHPNIVNVYDVGEDEAEEANFIVMELVEGITLKDYINKKGKLSVKEATSIAIQVSLGLEAAHNSNIVHRDVKPQNIIISTDGKVKLSDFGIARAVTSNTITSNVMVSVHYSSPEQVRGGYSDKKSDIYSLGITMYEMVTGRVPFDGDTSVAIAIKHLQEEIVPPSKYTPDLPYSLEQIILKCTQKSVDRRYENMSEVIDDLKHSLVDPQGSFVTLVPLSNHAQTVRISEQEMNAIKEGKEDMAGVYQEDSGETEDSSEDDGEEEEDDDDDRSGGKLEKVMTVGGFIIGAVIICILVYFIGTAAGFFGGSTEDEETVETTEETDETDETTEETTDSATETVTVPDITGMTEEEAEAALSGTGLGLVKAAEESSDTYAKGVIMAQSIAAGETVEMYSTIEYTLSTGPAALTVPNVVGMTQSDAETTLTDMGLTISVTQEYSSDVENGYVISVSPEVGTTVNSGDTVSIVVSQGESPVEVTVPNVSGLAEETAKTILENQGLVVTVETGSSNSVGEGEVYEQSISSGTTVSSGTEITITINSATSVTESEDDSTDSEESSSGTWVCSERLGEPSNYTGGEVMLVLEQTVDDETVTTTILEGETITFPYSLEVTGATGVDSGTVYLYELVDGEYVERAHYDVPFSES